MSVSSIKLRQIPVGAVLAAVNGEAFERRIFAMPFLHQTRSWRSDRSVILLFSQRKWLDAALQPFSAGFPVTS